MQAVGTKPSPQEKQVAGYEPHTSCAGWSRLLVTLLAYACLPAAKCLDELSLGQECVFVTVAGISRAPEPGPDTGQKPYPPITPSAILHHSQGTARLASDAGIVPGMAMPHILLSLSRAA